MDAACDIAAHKVPVKIVLQRKGQAQAQLNPVKGDRDYYQEMERAKHDGLGFEQCVDVDSEDPLYR